MTVQELLEEGHTLQSLINTKKYQKENKLVRPFTLGRSEVIPLNPLSLSATGTRQRYEIDENIRKAAAEKMKISGSSEFEGREFGNNLNFNPDLGYAPPSPSELLAGYSGGWSGSDSQSEKEKGKHNKKGHRRCSSKKQKK